MHHGQTIGVENRLNLRHHRSIGSLGGYAGSIFLDKLHTPKMFDQPLHLLQVPVQSFLAITNARPKSTLRSTKVFAPTDGISLSVFRHAPVCIGHSKIA